MRWKNWWSAAAVLSAVLGGAQVSQAQALTGAADVLAESDASLDRMRSAAYSALTRQEYALQPDGNLRGKVRTVDSAGSLTPARVKLFFVRHGEIISQASPDANGVFQAGGLAPGYYSVISQGDGGFSSVGVKVVPPPEKVEAPKANTIGRTREVALTKVQQQAGADTLNLIVVRPEDVTAAWGVANMMNGAAVAAAPQASTNRLVAADKAADAVAADAVTYDDELLIAAYERGTFVLRPDGKISGTLMMFDPSFNYVVAPNMPAFFLRNGRVVAQTRSDAQGNYEVALSPGYYSFVTAGMGKFGAQGITVSAPTIAEEVPVPAVKSISFSRALQGRGVGPGGGGGGQGDAQAAGGGGPGAGGQAIAGTATGAGGGGAGGGGGLGGLGGIAGIVGAGAAVGAVASQNNNSSNNSGGNSDNTTVSP